MRQFTWALFLVASAVCFVALYALLYALGVTVKPLPYVGLLLVAAAVGVMGRALYALHKAQAKAVYRLEKATPNQPATEIVRTKRLEFVDDEGRIRGLLLIDSEGKPRLGLFDENGKLLWSAPE